MLYPKIDTIFERDEKTLKVKTDSYKDPVLSLINKWEFTEKIDGTNIRLEKIGLAYTHIGGRTENAEVPKQILAYINDKVSMDKLEDIFGEKNIIIFGEGYGGKIQSGERDKLRGGKYSDTEKFIVFDILVQGVYWLKRENIENVCKSLELDVVPLLSVESLDEAWMQTKLGFKSKLGDGSLKAEGMIGKTTIPLFDAKHRRIICKTKTEDF